MAADSQSPEAPAVALLFEDAEQSAYLRDALKALGARIVHEGAATTVEQQMLLDAGADVVVVNLDDEVEAHLDRVYDALDESRHRVIFNDAEASRGLSGWDQARWARHLAAKLMGALDVDPPRPADARAVEPRSDEAAVAGFGSDAEAPPEAADPEMIAVASPPVGDADEPEEDPALAESLNDELQALLAEGEGLLNEAGADEAGDAETGVILAPLDDAFADLDIDAGSAASPDAGDEADMFARVDAAGEAPESELIDADALFASAEPDTAADIEGRADAAPDATAEDSSVPSAVEVDVVSDLGEAADAVPAATSFGELSLADDVDGGTAGADEGNAEAKDAALDVPDWGLVDFEFETPAEAVHAEAETRADPNEFGIEKVSASEFLSPDDEGNEAEIEPGLTLELVSLEEAMAPSLSDMPAHEMMLDEATGLPRLVVVAGDAADMSPVERFLAALPNGMPMAVLVLAYAGETAELDALAARLDAAAAMRVRGWSAGMTLRAGDAAVVSADMPVRVGRGGSAKAVDEGESLTLCTQAFGPDLLALVCGGPAGELADALQTVRDGGGHVWAHVDDAEPPHEAVEHGRQRGLVEHAEPVEALAARLSAELGLTP